MQTFFRVLYLKYQSPLLHGGEERIAFIYKWLVFVICLLLTAGHIAENVIFGTRDNNSMVYFNFFNDFSVNLHDFEELGCRINVILIAISNIMEFACFLVISYELLKLHMNRVRLNVAATHGRKNVITAMGHFLSWFIEIISIALCTKILFSKEEYQGLAPWILFMLYPSINYVFPTIQILTSPELRDNVFGSSCVNYCECDSGDPEAAVEEIAMNNINNNN